MLLSAVLCMFMDIKRMKLYTIAIKIFTPGFNWILALAETIIAMNNYELPRIFKTVTRKISYMFIEFWWQLISRFFLKNGASILLVMIRGWVSETPKTVTIGSLYN